jgi:hypothetical protein
MREVLSKSLTLRGFIYYEFAVEHYPTFLRTVSAAIADGRIRYREDIIEGLENAPAAFIGMLEATTSGRFSCASRARIKCVDVEDFGQFAITACWTGLGSAPRRSLRLIQGMRLAPLNAGTRADRP